MKVWIARLRLWVAVTRFNMAAESAKRKINEWNRLGKLLKEQERNGG